MRTLVALSLSPFEPPAGPHDRGNKNQTAVNPYGLPAEAKKRRTGPWPEVIDINICDLFTSGR
jgi:hypothetical protein